jgi:5'-nucleotidase/UDP-sugar diphosphatase
MAKTSADLSLMNSGGIRAGLPRGNITYKDVLKVSPFGNTICTVMLTREELTNYLEKAVNMEKNTNSFAQIFCFPKKDHPGPDTGKILV